MFYVLDRIKKNVIICMVYTKKYLYYSYGMEKMKNEISVNRSLAITGALGALIIVLFITHLGFIPWFSGAAITILQVPVILGALLAGLWPGVALGAIFGIASLIQASMTPTGALDPYFTNPLISVLPRMIIGFVTYFSLKALLLATKKLPKIFELVSYGLAAFLGSLANTFFVLASLIIFAQAITWEVLFAVLVSNGILEAVASVVLSVAVISVVKVVSHKKSKLSEIDDNENLHEDLE